MNWEWVGYVAAMIAAVWVYRDAKQRESKRPLLWAIGVLGVLIVFLPLYLIFRPRKKTAPIPCPHCGKMTEGKTPFCPDCGQIL